MERIVHFERMRETGRAVIPLIKELYVEFGLKCPSLSRALDLFVEKRTNFEQCLLRPYLVRLAYEVCGGNYWLEIAPVCAAFEVFNISTYQSNIAFDGKKGLVSDISRNNQFICSMISADLATKALLKLSETFDLKLISGILNRIYETNDDIYIGQFYNLNKLDISNLDLLISLSDYLTIYIPRCERLGGSLTGLCLEVGGLLAGADSNTLDNLRNIGYMLGTAGQMVNDISDFIPPKTEGNNIKGYEASFSDIRMGIVTYPVFHFLKHGKDQEKQTVLNILRRRRQLALDEMGQLTNCLCQTGSIKSARNLVLSYYIRLKKEVKKLPKSEMRDLLSLSFSSLRNNKYFTTLKELRENNGILEEALA